MCGNLFTNRSIKTILNLILTLSEDNDKRPGTEPDSLVKKSFV